MKKFFCLITASVVIIGIFLNPTFTYADSLCDDPIKDIMFGDTDDGNNSDQYVNIYLFYSEMCPHCEVEREFLEDYKGERNGDVRVYEYEVAFDSDNFQLLSDVAEELKISSQYVPLTVVCGETVVGFGRDGIEESRIREIVDEWLPPIVDDNTSASAIDKSEISVPLLGNVDLKDFSLPVVTVLLGFLDGFNPCAMWVLLYLISMLLGMKDRKKMWFVGVTFIVSSAFVYFLFMTSWLNFFLFIGFIKWVRILIGGVAIASGATHLKDYWDTRPGCKATDEEKRKRIQYKINKIVADKRFWIVVVSIMGLAFSVNLIELVCSAGFPAIYTHMLSLSDLSTLQYYLYLLLYVFVFMVDDLAIFFIAMITLHATGISTKYKRISSLVGGILILLIGLLLIFRPEVLMFS